MNRSLRGLGREVGRDLIDKRHARSFRCNRGAHICCPPVQDVVAVGK